MVRKRFGGFGAAPMKSDGGRAGGVWREGALDVVGGDWWMGNWRNLAKIWEFGYHTIVRYVSYVTYRMDQSEGR